MNDEVRRRLHNNNAPIRYVPLTDDDNGDTPGLGIMSDSEPEEDEVLKMRRYTSQKLGRIQHTKNILHRYARIAGKEAQYMDLFPSLQGEEDIFDGAEVTNIVQRDECFLLPVDLNEDVGSIPTTRCLVLR